MIRFAADEFASVFALLELVGMGDAGMNRLVSSPHPFNLNALLESCQKLKLQVAAKHVEEVLAQLGRLQPPTLKDQADQVLEALAKHGASIADTLRRDLSTKLFLAIPEEASIELFENERPFDNDTVSVNTQFPHAIYDIQEAANCLALRRTTACVCHLMRVLEVGLRALARDLHVPWSNRNDWQDVINAIEGKIKLYEKGTGDLPADWREKRQFYADAATQFTHFKDAWRNYAMHFHAIYDDSKARTIFWSVGDFMRVLATRLSSVPPVP